LLSYDLGPALAIVSYQLFLSLLASLPHHHQLFLLLVSRQPLLLSSCSTSVQSSAADEAEQLASFSASYFLQAFAPTLPGPIQGTAGLNPWTFSSSDR
jgi:hypothetical protein